MTWLIIVVEDTADDSQLVSTILQHSGIEVYLAAHGRECLQMLESLELTCIITDLNMPVMDGWELLQNLQQNPDTNAIPVMALTAYYSANVAADAIKAGFAGFFAKPVNPRTFVEKLEELLA
jgi:two-component system, cell cycle response regulator DivK